MGEAQQIIFGPFALDTSSKCLKQGLKKMPLRTKGFTLLRYLLEHPNRLVTKEELVKAVWGHTKVVDSVLKVGIREIRQTLGDAAGAPKFIETIGHKGYRFITPVTYQFSERHDSEAQISDNYTYFVGRTPDLQQLEKWLQRALKGERQIIFVTGEAGIGKTTLVDAFVRNLSNDEAILFIQGQCIEQYGAGEAYMPILMG